MPPTIATVIGATGLIGSHLVEQLQNDNSFDKVRILVRRPVALHHLKIDMRLIDFQDEEAFKLAMEGSTTVFCAVGTTQKKVKGDKEAYRKVDYDIPVNAARFCAETGCEKFLLVSSVGADSKSKNFYLQLKGEVEDAIKKLPIKSISIFRPSMLMGKRNEFRLGERIFQPLLSFFAFLLFGKWQKYRPIEAEYVAKAMITAAKENKPGVEIYEYQDIRSMTLGKVNRITG